MMNILAIGLLLASLAASAVWSPTPEISKTAADQVIVKDGNRVIVVEYEDLDTKVSVSESNEKPPLGSAIKRAQEKLRPDPRASGLTEPICDALGECKDKISELAREAGGEAKQAAADVASAAREGVKEAVGKAKAASKTAKETMRDVWEATLRTEEEMREQAAKVAEDLAFQFRTVLRWVWAAGGSVFAVERAAAAVEMLGFCAAYGMGAWVTFASSYVLASALPRQQLAVVQSKIYRVYFRGMAYCIGVALAGHLVGQRKRLMAVSRAEVFQCFSLVSSLLLDFTNLMYLEPRATKVMFEKMKLEKEEGRGRGRDEFTQKAPRDTNRGEEALPAATPTPKIVSSPPGSGRLEEDQVKDRFLELNERLRRLNTNSSFLNVLTLMALTWHLVYLSQRLHMGTC